MYSIHIHPLDSVHLRCGPVRFSGIVRLGKINEIDESKADVLSIGLITPERLALLGARDVHS